MADLINEAEGRSLFGLRPDHYASARPNYPESIYSSLLEHNVLAPECSVLEIGSGSGLATKRLLELGADPLTAVEPDGRFAAQLASLVASHGSKLGVVHQAFEEVELDVVFDLAVAATSFHWLAPDVRVRKLAEVIKPGGHAALWWNVFQDPGRQDPFHDATANLLTSLAVSPSGAPDGLPFALNRSEREAEFAVSGKFRLILYSEAHWTLVLKTQEVGLLYEGFASIQRLPDVQRFSVLEELMAIAESQFGGVVERYMTSPLYVFERLA